ncbi:MAG: hypothetical protein ACI959_000744 [Limisphaerales bacterium]|jgi:hypothetical protein
MNSSTAIFKTVLVIGFAIVNLISPLPPINFGAPLLLLPFAFMLPILSVAGNPIGRKYFARPSWDQNPLKNNNRLIFAQFGAVFLLVFAATILLGALIHKQGISEMAYFATALGAGYAVSIPLGLKLVKSAKENSK